jgi:predicted metal-dependent peptidase
MKMSDEIGKTRVKHVEVAPAIKKQKLQTAIYNLQQKYVFFASVLQCMNITYSDMVPTAGVRFNSKTRKWEMYINADFFCNKLTDENRKAVLLHEMLHITHKHPLRLPFEKIDSQKRQVMNIAMDMAINQYISGLPAGCDKCPSFDDRKQGAHCENEDCPGSGIDVNDFYDEDENGKKTPWEKEKTTEYYFLKLQKWIKDNPESGFDQGPGQGQGGVGTLDEHHWESNAAESEMLDATEDLVKRAIQKSGLTKSDLPGSIKELLDDIDARRNELNYKKIIESAIKRHASGTNRENTWSRPSRRFGNKAPGRRNGELPQIANFIDTSGSISVQEANDFLDIIDNLLKVGSRKCTIDLWHTSVYHHVIHKLGQRFNKEDFQSGGTDVNGTLEEIYKRKPDLSVILTDGCYWDVEYENWLKPGENFPQVLWIISRDGQEEHPLARLGQTIKIPEGA